MGLPQDPQTTTYACGAITKSHYTKNCRACQAPILRPDGGAAMYDPQGNKPLPAPSQGGHLQGHSAEPIMLWTGAILNPTGPLEINGDWPAAPDLPHLVAYGKDALGLKLQYTTSNSVAKAWGVDHSALCGKFLNHRHRRWGDLNPPPLFYLWRTGDSQYGPLGVALMPVWFDQRIAYTGFLEDGSTTPGMWKPVDRMPDFPTGVFEREEMPPFLFRWPDDWAPKSHRRMRAAQPTGPQATSTDQQGPASSPNHGDAPEQLLYGPKQGPKVQWEAVAGMAWIRPDPGNTHGSPLWSAAPRIPGRTWAPLKLSPGENSAFVLRLQDYVRRIASPEVPGH